LVHIKLDIAIIGVNIILNFGEYFLMILKGKAKYSRNNATFREILMKAIVCTK
jgi:hypothetical protein